MAGTSIAAPDPVRAREDRAILRALRIAEARARERGELVSSPEATIRLFRLTLAGVQPALRVNAAAVLVAHNHPSGDPEPSAADRYLTTRLRDSLALVDVLLLDHVVIGAARTVSLAARGWL